MDHTKVSKLKVSNRDMKKESSKYDKVKSIPVVKDRSKTHKHHESHHRVHNYESSSSSSKSPKTSHSKKEKDHSSNKVKKTDSNSSKHKAKHTDERKHADKASKSTSSSTSSRSNHSKKSKLLPDKAKKIIAKADEDGFNSTMASFEDCLGLNDMKKSVKKKKKATQSQILDKSEIFVPMKRIVTEHRNLSSSNSQSSSTINSYTTSKFETRSDEFENSPEDIFSAPLPPKMMDLSAVDIESTLPEIQPNYKPQRYPDSPPRKRKTDVEVDPGMFMSSKRCRTQVFSGRKNAVGAVPSLYELCIRMLQENIDALEFTGGVPYDRLKPVLERCTPQQLYQIEDYNSYLIEDTDELWREHCNQDFKGQKAAEMETWREFYLRRFDEREAKLKNLTASISRSMAKAVPVRQTKLAYVDTVAKPPRQIARKQARFGTGLAVAAPMKAGPPTKATPRPAHLATNAAAAESSSAVHAQKPAVKKVAPLMQKTLKFMKNRFKR